MYEINDLILNQVLELNYLKIQITKPKKKLQNFLSTHEPYFTYIYIEHFYMRILVIAIYM